MKTNIFYIGIILMILAFSIISCEKDKDEEDQIPTQGLVAYYPFKGNVNDESGHENHRKVYGATLTTDRFGNPNSAYSFDGMGDYISISHSSDFDFSLTEQISVEVWTYINYLRYSDNTPLSKDAHCHDFAYCIDIHGDRYVEAGVHAGWYWILVFSPEKLTLNKWHQIVATIDEVRIYKQVLTDAEI
ncbi:MAG: hypothetical protein KAT48_09640 [Bacteroidales bacterium]|nr:hypothetical protein [Bacteroidales bacterium]